MSKRSTSESAARSSRKKKQRLQFNAILALQEADSSSPGNGDMEQHEGPVVLPVVPPDSAEHHHDPRMNSMSNIPVDDVCFNDA